MPQAKRFSGIYAPIATVFNENDTIDWKAMETNIAYYNQTRLAGVVVLGSNGEFALLSHAEKVDLIAFVHQHLSSDKRLIAGSGCESTAETILLGKEAAEAGADAALVVTPWYYKGSYSDSVLERHYQIIADDSPLPVMLYNMPRNTGVNISAALAAKLAKHPNIIGIKDSSGDIVQITNTINNTPDHFTVFAGSGSFLMATIQAGGDGGTLAIANIMPNECVQLYEAALAGDTVKARELQQRIMQPNAAVTSGLGIPGLKKALDLIGLRGGMPRKPLLPLSDTESEKLMLVLRNAGLDV